MKVGLVVVGGLARDPRDGAIPALHWLVQRLATRHEVHAFTLFGTTQQASYAFRGAQVHHAGNRRRGLRTVSAIRDEHRRSTFDLLHAFWLVPGGAIAAAAARLIRRPLLGHIGGGELVGLPDVAFGHQLYWKGRLWARLALGACARVTAASTGAVAEVERRGYRAERVPLGVDLGSWPVTPPRPRAGGPVRLLHVSSLNPVKDQATLLRCAQRLVELNVDFSLDIVGADTLNGSIQSHASELGLSNRVRFHGWLDQSALRALALESHLLLHTARFETGPVVVLEAALAGVPTVGTAVGHIAEWSPNAAVAVPVGDDQALARETLALLGDEDRRLRLAAEAQRRAIAQDADWTARRFEQLYEEVVSEASDRGRG